MLKSKFFSIIPSDIVKAVAAGVESLRQERMTRLTGHVESTANDYTKTLSTLALAERNFVNNDVGYDAIAALRKTRAVFNDYRDIIETGVRLSVEMGDHKTMDRMGANLDAMILRLNKMEEDFSGPDHGMGIRSMAHAQASVLTEVAGWLSVENHAQYGHEDDHAVGLRGVAL